VSSLKSIPFDYREQHTELFSKEAMKSMMDKVIGQTNQNLHQGASLSELAAGAGS